MCCRTPLGIHRDYSDHGMLREKVSCETEVLHSIPGRNEENMIRRFSYSATLAASLLILLTFSCGKTFAPQPELKKEAAKPAPSIPRIEVTPAIQTKALTPKPGAKAVRKEVADTFGKGKASIMIKGHPGGVNHSFWSEELDLDGSGNAVPVDEVWDNRHKVLYLSKERPFRCGNGQTADGSTLMAVYGKGNTLGKPIGSGWWVAELDAGECNVQAAGIYGCHFDAGGTNKICGAAVVQAAQDEVVIEPLPATPPDATPGSAGSAPAPLPVQSATTPAPGGGDPK